MNICVECESVAVQTESGSIVEIYEYALRVERDNCHCRFRWITNPVTGEKTYPRCCDHNPTGNCPDFKPKEPKQEDESCEHLKNLE